MAKKDDALVILGALTTLNTATNESGSKALVDSLRAADKAIEYANAMSGGVLAKTVESGATNTLIAASLITAITGKINHANANESGFRVAVEVLAVAVRAGEDNGALGESQV